MAFSISSIKDLLKRNEKAKDLFGADDDEDFYDDDMFYDESDGGTLVRKTFIWISGALGLLIVGFVTTAIITADETAGPLTGVIPTEIAQTVSEDGEILQMIDMPEATSSQRRGASATRRPSALPPFSSDGASIPMPSKAIADDSTAKTYYRSSSRRPWLGGGAEPPAGTRVTRDQPMTNAAPGRAGTNSNSGYRYRCAPLKRPFMATWITLIAWQNTKAAQSQWPLQSPSTSSTSFCGWTKSFVVVSLWNRLPKSLFNSITSS